MRECEQVYSQNRDLGDERYFVFVSDSRGTNNVYVGIKYKPCFHERFIQA